MVSLYLNVVVILKAIFDMVQELEYVQPVKTGL